MNLETLEQAAFWSRCICMDCEADFEPPPDERCPVCGSEAVHSAEFILKCAEWANSD